LKKLTISDLLLFENEDFFLVNKPPFVSTLSERHDDKAQNMLRLARDYWPEAQAGHRLDRETSGVLIFAKHPEAYRHISMQFEHRQVTKIYHAVVTGIHEFQGILVNLPILPLKTGFVKIDKQEGKEAETVFNNLEIFKAHTLVECMPFTGRMHQIRIHLQCLKAPIVMDSLYGGEPIYLSQIKRKFKLAREAEEQPLISRFALHARALNFAMMNGERQMVEAPYPKDMEALLRQLEKNR
jgi:23S rRNA pseudouridine955/2504/2580 synthase